MRYAAPRVLEVLDLEPAQLVAAQRVIEQGGKYGAVALALERYAVGCVQQPASLVISKRRRLAFVTFGLGTLHALDGVMGDGIALTQILEQRRQRRQAMPDGHAAQGALRQVVAPGDDVRAGHVAKLLRLHDAGEPHEILQRVFVGAPGALVAEVGEPLDFAGHVGQTLEVGGGQEPGRGGEGAGRSGVLMRSSRLPQLPSRVTPRALPAARSS